MTGKKTTKRRRTATKKGEGIGNLIPLVLPMLKKIIPALGMAAATGAISGAASNAVQKKGKGLSKKPGRPRKPGRPKKTTSVVKLRGKGLLLGPSSLFKNIPLLNILL